MKKIITPSILFACILLISSCKKDNEPNFNTDEVRLIGVDSKISATDVSHTVIEYDGNGRINRVSSHMNNQTAQTVLNISYSGNVILLVKPPINDAGSTIIDTTRLFLNSTGQVTQRISSSYQEFKAPFNQPQKTFIYDTTTNEYDADGFLKKASKESWDSTSVLNQSNGMVSTSIIHDTYIANHTISNGNLTAISSIGTMSSETRYNGTIHTFKKSTENNITYHYTNSSANKTDFTNAAILDEINILTFAPINKNYKNLPDKNTETTIEKDQNGSVTNTFTSSVEWQYTYNSYGFIATMFDPAVPDYKTTYIYNK